MSSSQKDQNLYEQQQQQQQQQQKQQNQQEKGRPLSLDSNLQKSEIILKKPLLSDEIHFEDPTYFEVETKRKLNLSQEIVPVTTARKRDLAYTLHNNPAYLAKLKMSSINLDQKQQQKYNPYKSPPDITFAKRHGKSRRVCKKIEDQKDKETCPCCGYIIDNEQFELCCNTKQFAHLGTSFPLYFNFIKQAFLFICLQLIIQSIPSLIINHTSGSEECDENAFICTFSFLNLMSGSYIGRIQIESILNFLSIIMQLFVIEFLKIYQKNLKYDLVKNRVSVSDYSLIIQKLPLDITSQEIEDYLEQTVPGSKDNIVRVFMLYDIQNYQKTYEKEQKLIKKNLEIKISKEQTQKSKVLDERQKEKIIEQYSNKEKELKQQIKQLHQDKKQLEQQIKREGEGTFVSTSTLRKTQNQSLMKENINTSQKLSNNNNIKEISFHVANPKEVPSQRSLSSTDKFDIVEDKKIQYLNNTSNVIQQQSLSIESCRLSENLNSSSPEQNTALKFSGNAILTFNTYQARKEISKALSAQTLTEMFVIYINRFTRTWCRRRKNNLIYEDKIKRFTLKNRLIRVQKAPEPSDILWANIGTTQSKIKLRIQSYVIVYVCLVVVCILLALIKIFIQNEQEQFNNQIWALALTLLASSAVAGGNVIIGIVIRGFAEREQRKTQTEYFVNTGNKLTNMFAANMILTTIFSNITTYFSLTDEKGNTPLNMPNIINTYFFLFITNSYLSSLFSIFDIVWGWRLLKRYRVLHYEDVKNTTTQAEANEIFEDHPVDMALRYANILKNVQFALAVSPLIPLGVPMCLVGLFIIYWVDKYLLIRRWVCSNYLSHVLSKEMMKQMNQATVYFALGNLLTMFMPTTRDIEDPDKTIEWEWPNFFKTAYFYLAVIGVGIALFVNYFPVKKASIYSIFNRFIISSYKRRAFDETYMQIKQDIPDLDDYDQYHPIFKNYSDKHAQYTSASFRSSFQEQQNDLELDNSKRYSLDSQRKIQKSSLESYSVFSTIQQQVKDKMQ